jgi:hypothetical protein
MKNTIGLLSLTLCAPVMAQDQGFLKIPARICCCATTTSTATFETWRDQK